MTSTWTIGELAERAAAALAVDGSPQVSGRVRDVPNERLIRWYTTIGLVDPPLGRRGRTALYGPRHLLQLVAVKRRQAAGRSIAEIQTELAGATDATLERIAALPFPATAPPPATIPGRASGARATPLRPRRPGREAARSTSPAAASPAGGPTSRADTPVSHAGTEPTPRPKVLDETADTSPTGHTTAPPPGSGAASPGEAGRAIPPNAPADAVQHGTAPTAESPAADTDPAGATPTASGTASVHSDRDTSRPAFWRERPDISYTETAVVGDYDVSTASTDPRPTVVQGVRLTPGLTLLLDVPVLDGEDLAAIETAARPLLDELRRRGLLTTDPSPAYPPADTSRRSP